MSLYIKITEPVKIVPFTPDMADDVRGSAEHPIYYIQTREGLRMIDETMFVAIKKGGKYVHPMMSNVFQKDYRELPEECPIESMRRTIESRLQDGYVKHRLLKKLALIEQTYGVKQ